MYLWDYTIEDFFESITDEGPVRDLAQAQDLIRRFKEEAEATRQFLASTLERDPLRDFERLLDHDARLYGIVEALYLSIKIDDLHTLSSEEMMKDLERFYRKDYFMIERDRMPFDELRLISRYSNDRSAVD